MSNNIFPFNFEIVANIVQPNPRSRAGWYLQQLIKLYAGFYIPDILDHYLVIDSDVFFLREIEFMDKDNIPYYALGEEYHIPYFNHMLHLHPSLTKQINQSAICHHMMFNRNYISELFQLVENTHNEIFWKVFLQKVTEKTYNSSGTSEYEMYLNYMLQYYPDKIKIRELSWRNIYNWSDIKFSYDFVAFHHYVRPL